MTPNSEKIKRDSLTSAARSLSGLIQPSSRRKKSFEKDAARSNPETVSKKTKDRPTNRRNRCKQRKMSLGQGRCCLPSFVHGSEQAFITYFAGGKE